MSHCPSVPTLPRAKLRHLNRNNYYGSEVGGGEGGEERAVVKDGGDEGWV